VRLSIEELAREAGVPVRTVRYYISQGLLPGPAARGRAAAYDDEHLARLRLVRRLVEQHVPLAEQRDRLARLSGNDVERLLRDDDRRGAALRRASQAASPQTYISGLLDQARMARAPLAESERRPSFDRGQPVDAQSWRRWELAPGIELHASTEAARSHPQLIERLLRVSRESPSRRSEHDAAFEDGDSNDA
jgi:DNA-binding transcriptional MerR regulator